MIECILYDNDCMTVEKRSMNPVGIVIHSTGANNKSIKRYVQPSISDSNYNNLMKIIGANKYGNHWNRGGVYKSSHYFIGELNDGTVEICKTLPHNVSAWGVGKGSYGSYNYDPTGHIQIEVCEDNLSDVNYFNECYNKIIMLCAEICINEHLNPTKIVSHRESYIIGYGSNHRDIDHWLNKFGVTMDELRKDVADYIDNINIAKALHFSGEIIFNGEKYEINGEARKR